jgi:glucose/arabinose dehydrogenase
LGKRIAGVFLVTIGAAGIATLAFHARAYQKNSASTGSPVLKGQGAFGDWTTDAPGVRRQITAADLPKPFATSSSNNQARVAQKPGDTRLQVPTGFVVTEFQTGLENPRLIRTAPNGDIFLAEMRPGRIRVLRAAKGAAHPEVNEVFASGLKRPFGIAFYPLKDPKYVYVANTDSVVRFAYKNGDLKASGDPETIISGIPAGGPGGSGHTTRDIAFSNDGKKLFLSVGSGSNVAENPNVSEEKRADILEYNPDGSGFRTYATGIRNPVGIATHPQTGELWCSVNERDGLGDDLVPDYITRVKDGGFYGWPWFYIGGNQDPRHQGAHAELKDKVIVPDVLIQSHSASLQMVFYTGTQFPREYVNGAFASEHGSWNREKRTGYKVIFVPVRNGVPTGEYIDFLTGFVTAAGDVWGRPVGVTVANDGSLLVTDDGTNTVWKVAYQQK